MFGLRELRGAVSNYLRKNHGINYSPDNIMIGPGSKELMFILQLACYGDLVIPTPSWVSYAPQASVIGRNARLYDFIFKPIQIYILSDLMWFENATIHDDIDTGFENLNRNDGASDIKHRIAIPEFSGIH